MDGIRYLERQVDSFSRCWTRPIACLILAFIVSSCDKVEYMEFDDAVLKPEVTDKYERTSGLKGMYVLWGTYVVFGHKVKAGQVLTPRGLRAYSIQKLLDKYPAYATSRARQAASKQKLY